jgi:hypothetical protein
MMMRRGMLLGVVNLSLLWAGSLNADTIQTRAFLTGSEFQDGQPAGSITPSDMRDFIVSALPNETTVTFASPSMTWNLATDPAGTVSVTANTTITASNGENGMSYALCIKQDATGRTITLAGVTLIGAGTINTSPNSVSFVSVNVRGGVRYASIGS